VVTRGPASVRIGFRVSRNQIPVVFLARSRESRARGRTCAMASNERAAARVQVREPAFSGKRMARSYILAHIEASTF
jgi:hypothetical protein